ncbi:aminoglycoside phosphotransferase family protein [Saccharothrix coeruleofusca]|uniref:aminoglycoside phosphotransferase family protein n=1 Tax=Saccharothrix coeruleofusca TaxID=33919 RepID=UPI0016712D5F|nr:aminoglycoside phosphotransferase family protein [Saccharothrix coeruleofusca]
MEWARAVAAAFGLGEVLEPWTPVTGGASHLVWRLRTTRGDWAVKRVNRSWEAWWTREHEVAAAIQLEAWNLGVPMPRPVHPLRPSAPLLADVRVDGEVGSFLAHEWCEGTAPTSPTPELLDWVGATLAVLHELPAGPRPDARPHAVEEWREWLDGVPGDFADRVRSFLPDIAAAEEVVDEAARDPRLTPVRTHRDVKPDNVLLTSAAPLLVDWDGAGADFAEWELTRTALAFDGTAEGFTRVVRAYERAGGRPPGPDPVFLAGVLHARLGGAAYMVWRALGHRPVTPPERAAAHGHALELLSALRVALPNLERWARLLAR